MSDKTPETQKAEEELKIPEVRTAKDVTPEVADKIVEEVLDYQGRRPVPLPDGRTLYIRLPDSGEDRTAEEIYSKCLFKYKKDGVPFIAGIAQMVLAEVSAPETFGKRERRVINEKQIEEIVEKHRIEIERWEKAKKKSPDLEMPADPDVPEPIVDEGSPSLKEILEGQESGPFSKTNAIMACLANTEYANLVVHSAEYMAGRERSRFVVSQIIETVKEIDDEDGKRLEFTPLWKRPKDTDIADSMKRMQNEKPEIIGYLEGMYITYQQEMLQKDFLQKLSSVQSDGKSKK
jgi:hypothetical protein